MPLDEELLLRSAGKTGHVVTVEDPIEYLHRHNVAIVNQREVGSDTHSFAGALKHVLRQDPDVILVGEMRDLETIAAAITIAETGHLTFGTLHTNSCAQTINRIIDVFTTTQQPQVRAQLSLVLEGDIPGWIAKRISAHPSRGRAVESLLQQAILPPISNEVLQRKRTGQELQNIQLMVENDSLSVYFD